MVLGRIARKLGGLEDILGDRVGKHARHGDSGADGTLCRHGGAEADNAEQDEDDALDLDTDGYGLWCILRLPPLYCTYGVAACAALDRVADGVCDRVDGLEGVE